MGACFVFSPTVVLRQESSSDRQDPSDCFTRYKDAVNLPMIINNNLRTDGQWENITEDEQIVTLQAFLSYVHYSRKFQKLIHSKRSSYISVILLPVLKSPQPTISLDSA